jgi:hypothetical protein
MNTASKPWWMLISGILALSIAYTAVLLHRGTALAGPMKCPAEPQEQCDGQNCKHHNRPA